MGSADSSDDGNETRRRKRRGCGVEQASGARTGARGAEEHAIESAAPSAPASTAIGSLDDAGGGVGGVESSGSSGHELLAWPLARLVCGVFCAHAHTDAPRGVSGHRARAVGARRDGARCDGGAGAGTVGHRPHAIESGVCRIFARGSGHRQKEKTSKKHGSYFVEEQNHDSSKQLQNVVHPNALVRFVYSTSTTCRRHARPYVQAPSSRPTPLSSRMVTVHTLVGHQCEVSLEGVGRRERRASR
jgi:hypothetical protein